MMRQGFGNAQFEVSCMVEEAEIDSREAEERVDVEKEDAVEEGNLRVRHFASGNEASYV